MVAGKPYRCWECALMVAHVNSQHVCDRCIKRQKRELAASHDAIVKKIGNDRW